MEGRQRTSRVGREQAGGREGEGRPPGPQGGSISGTSLFLPSGGSRSATVLPRSPAWFSDLADFKRSSQPVERQVGRGFFPPLVIC